MSSSILIDYYKEDNNFPCKFKSKQKIVFYERKDWIKVKDRNIIDEK